MLRNKEYNFSNQYTIGVECLRATDNDARFDTKTNRTPIGTHLLAVSKQESMDNNQPQLPGYDVSFK